MLDIFNEINVKAEEIISIRRDIHMHPELGKDVLRTAGIVESTLNNAGVSTVRTAQNAVIGRLHGGHPGMTVALRADMDALPQTEKNDIDFRSQEPGRMHACGHDVHTAALLGAAMVLAEHRESLHGNVVFLFEPDEEGMGGAKDMIEAGCLEGVDAVFGAHVDPYLPEGHVGVKYGKFYAASDEFDIRIKGKSCHGAERDKGIDALEAAAMMATELLKLPEKVTSDRCVLTVGELHAGTANNIVADSAILRGMTRTLGSETREAMKQALYSTIESIAEKTRTEVEMYINSDYSGVVNDEAMTSLAYDAAVSCFGKDKVTVFEEPRMASEDFGSFQNLVPGSFYNIGAGCGEPLHSNKFLPTEKALLTTASMHLAVVMKYFDRL